MSAVLLIALVVVSFSVSAADGLLERHPGWPVAIGGIAAIAALAAIQLAHLALRRRARTVRWTALTLLTQAALVYGPFLLVHDGWVGTPYLLAASALSLLPGRLGRFVFGCVVVSIAALEGVLNSSLHDTLYYLMSVLALGLAIYGLIRLADLVEDLHDTRAELADLAVTRERLRFANDVHDVLGHSLSAISLKGELVNRLIDHQPARAKEELRSVLDVSRQALADVRAVAGFYRAMPPPTGPAEPAQDA